MYKNLLLFNSLFILTLISYGQVMQTQRYERVVKFNDEDFNVIQLKEDGIGLLQETNNYNQGKKIWNFIHIDTLLQEQSTITIDISTRETLIGFEHSSGEAHLLYSKNELKGEMLIITINLNSGKTSENYVKTELNFNPTHFCKSKENFIFGGFVNLEPCVLIYNTTQNALKLVPGFFQKDTELIDLRANHNHTFNTIVAERGIGENKKVLLRTYDYNGVLLFENNTLIGDSISLQNGISSTLKRDDLLILGTCGRKNTRTSNGIYSVAINPFNEEKLKPIYFGELEHYLDYLKPKRAAAIKQKTKRALERNKIPEYSSYLTPYKIIEHNKGFLLLAESFSPSANTFQPITTGYGYYPGNTSTYYPYAGYYNPYYNQRYSPASYGTNVLKEKDIKKIHSVAINFNDKGDPQWDFSFKFSSVQNDNLSQLSEVSLTEDSLFLFYKNESDIHVKSFNLINQNSKEHKIEIKGLYPFDEIRHDRNQNEGLTHWFGNTFYIWGYQEIRNKKREDRKRNVFYINKIKVN